MRRGRQKHELCDRMWRFIAVDESGCWRWLGQKSRNGYGLFDPDTAGPYKRAHRVMYQLVLGVIPGGLHLHHNCFVRECVNPAHLEPMTRAENNRRSSGVKRKKYERKKPLRSHCKNGHEFTAENTRMSAVGARVCRACVRMRFQKYAQIRRAT